MTGDSNKSKEARKGLASWLPAIDAPPFFGLSRVQRERVFYYPRSNRLKVVAGRVHSKALLVYIGDL